MAYIEKETFIHSLLLNLHTYIIKIGLYLFLLQPQHGFSQTDPKRVSQCYNEDGFSIVSLYCGYNQVIHINQAYHGVHKMADIQHCSKLKNDCVIDMTNKYDWSKCEGMHSCVQQVKSMDMDQCKQNTGGKKQYMQVEYTCQQSPTEKQPKEQPKTTRPTPKPSVVKKMCTNFTGQESSVMLQSPAYPGYYISGSDCRCVIQAGEYSKIAVTFHEVDLEIRKSLCQDWLLLQSPNYKDSTVVACGVLQHQMRTLESKSNWLLLHFHTSRNDNEDPNVPGIVDRAGFKIEIQSTKHRPFNLKCYTVDPSFIDNLTLKNGKEDVSSNLVLPASDWTKVSKPGPLSSTASSSYKYHQIMLLTICTFGTWTMVTYITNLL